MKTQSNLKPWPPGTSGNPAGKPKGAKHLSTWIQEALEDEKFTYKLSNGKTKTGAPIKAIVQALVIKAIDGDSKTFDLLGKYGYGSKHDITSNNQSLAFDFRDDTRRYIKQSDIT